MTVEKFSCHYSIIIMISFIYIIAKTKNQLFLLHSLVNRNSLTPAVNSSRQPVAFPRNVPSRSTFHSGKRSDLISVVCSFLVQRRTLKCPENAQQDELQEGIE